MYAELRLSFPQETHPRAMSRLVRDLEQIALDRGASTASARVVPADPQHVAFSELHDCEVLLKARGDYSPSSGTPKDYICTCGKRYVIVETESDGTWWERTLS